MIQTFDILFSVSFMHNYFKDGKCKRINVIPDDTSKKLITKSGLIFKKTIAGFTILTESIRNGDEVMLSANKMDTKLQLNFFLIFDDSYLPNITELQDLEKNNIHFYSNSKLDQSEEDPNSLTLNSNQSIIAFQELTLMNKSEPQIQLAKGNEKFTWNLSNNTNPIANGWETGVYNLVKDNYSQYIYLNNQSIPQETFALLSIELNNSNILGTDNKLLQPKYQLKLKSKETFWQYIIKRNGKPENLIIEDTANTEIFEKTEELFTNNMPVTVFTSKQQIALTENRDEYFRLKLRNGDPTNDLILISNLPLPNMNTLSRIKDGKFYTQIFVNF